MVFDAEIRLPACMWTEEHTAQGFARRDSNVCFATLLEFGRARVRCGIQEFTLHPRYTRAILVPFRVTSGVVSIAGPEETGAERTFPVPVGEYGLVAAQAILSDGLESIDLFFTPRNGALRGSKILIKDSALSATDVLVESATTAGQF